MGTPDEKIFPHATGLALKTFCPFVQRTWITLEEKNIPYQYKEVNPYKKEKHFLDINPKGLVPAIEYKGQALYESLVLCEFLEEAYPQHEPHLLPEDPFKRALVRLELDHISKSILPAWFRTIQAQDPQKQKENREELVGELRKLAQKVKGPYFLGEQFSLVDVAIAPWIVRDYILIENRGFSRQSVGEGWEEYANFLETRETVLKTQSEHYAEIYARYLRDEAQSEAAKATRAGRAIP
ncbi:glutathione-S-transferase [Punctularia strigosozonata HHB-11173 SS5]|uniref:glutathione-S-transferase n=1 Tax=Punctularia strigosozonata (strain HHB-11173) TaxID=741275 RepID=UPI0004416922|nr:glutathione-S-transferase [Punctularia strigosozonata HHB-11173 SS5]EIN06772.1 glutathione-S-transferase [Punctularia strigosozonata HHB-11173 SS5]